MPQARSTVRTLWCAWVLSSLVHCPVYASPVAPYAPPFTLPPILRGLSTCLPCRKPPDDAALASHAETLAAPQTRGRRKRCALHASARACASSLREDRRDTPFGPPARHARAFGFAGTPGARTSSDAFFLRPRASRLSQVRLDIGGRQRRVIHARPEFPRTFRHESREGHPDTALDQRIR